MVKRSCDLSLVGRICLVGGTLLFIVLLMTDLLKNRPIAPILESPHDDDDFQSGSESNCLGAPYLYVTVHDKTANVLKYTRDGCFLSDSVLIMGAGGSNSDIELRSMAIGKHKDHEALFIADASNDNSRLLVFGKCIEDDTDYGRRPYIETVTESFHNSGVDHMYGVCLDNDGNVYISNQHTDCVLRFHVGDFNPMVLPRSLQLDGRFDYYDGTFIQFGLPKEHSRDKQGIRSIAHVKSKIWIAHEDLYGVAIADIQSGLVTDIIPLDVAVGLHYDEYNGLVFVSCKSKSRGGIVYALDSETYEISHSYYHHKMLHPTGMHKHNFSIHRHSTKMCLTATS
jgi:hypothetical protein